MIKFDVLFVWFSDDSERDVKFKELEVENERNKQVLTARVKQLQNEIDQLVKEKKSSKERFGLKMNFILSIQMFHHPMEK